MSGCYIKGVGIAAPGLEGFGASLEVLRGATAYVAAPETPYSPTLLPPNERRRATASIRQAFRAAEDAVTGASADARELASVFASSDADMAVLHRICASLAQSPRVISPTDFHNSVHNAASGYWSIAVQAQAVTTTLSAHDASFVAGLLEAVALVDSRDVLLVAYDAVAPEPLHGKRPMELSAGVALILGAQPGAQSLGRIDVTLGDIAETPSGNSALEHLRLANPALRALPLLELFAAEREGLVSLRGAGGFGVSITFTPSSAR